jgi:hypothetical protein
LDAFYASVEQLLDPSKSSKTSQRLGDAAIVQRAQRRI